MGENITISSGNNYGEPMEIGAIDAKMATCHYCKAVGHFATNCYKKAGNLKKMNLAHKGSASRKVTFKKPYPGKAGSARPAAKSYGKKPWENKSTFKRFIKELAEAITDDEEEEGTLVPKEGDEMDAHQETEAGFFYSDEEDRPPKAGAEETFEEIPNETDMHF